MADLQPTRPETRSQGPAQKAKRLLECLTELEADEKEIERLEDALKKTRSMRNARLEELSKLDPPKYDPEREFPPWVEDSDIRQMPLGEKLRRMHEWGVLLGLGKGTREEEWEKWRQCQSEGTPYDHVLYNRRMQEAFDELLKAKMQVLSDHLCEGGAMKLANFKFGGDNCKALLARALRTTLVGVCVFDLLLNRAPKETVNVMNTYVAADGTRSDILQAKLGAFTDWAVFNLPGDD